MIKGTDWMGASPQLSLDLTPTTAPPSADGAASTPASVSDAVKDSDDEVHIDIPPPAASWTAPRCTEPAVEYAVNLPKSEVPKEDEDVPTTPRGAKPGRFFIGSPGSACSESLSAYDALSVVVWCARNCPQGERPARAMWILGCCHGDKRPQL